MPKKRQAISGQQTGFTLIEIIIVVAILGIITAFALPSYQQSMLKGRRSDGQALLLDIAARMEKTLYSNGVYTTDLTDVGFATASAVDSPDKYYKASVIAATTACPISICFVIRATPQAAQTDDGLIEITSTGVKRRDKNNNGSATDAGEDSWK